MSEPIGSGVFVGVRLTEAREAMALRMTNLSNLVGVSYQMIYNYENGLKQPGAETFARICTVLNQPAHFFYNPNFDREYNHDAVHFRDGAALKSEMRQQAGTRLKWSLEFYSLLHRKLSLPGPNFPDVDAPTDPTLINQDLIEHAASEVRRLWNLGDDPLPNLIRTLELNGAVVCQTALDLPHMDGASFWSENRARPFILLNMDKASYVRSRFDAAHELGHMLLHRNVVEGVVRGTPLYKRMENQAHNFASALLLPRKSWLKDVRSFTLGVFKSLKPKWRASIQAMIMRAAALGAISPDKKTSLMKQLSARQWRTMEPYDEIWEVERPRLLSQATTMLVENGLGISVITQAFPPRSDNLSEITGLPKAFFETETLPIKMERGVLN